ncbi:MAG: hypothetical protein EPN17_15925 [Methylobacter sp.]|nr:MAG: hypothetical protein EPN17_15925 [Methylobacter sp.]
MLILKPPAKLNRVLSNAIIPSTFFRRSIIANLSVRKLEEEVRQILKQAVTNPIKLGDMALQLFGENQGVELELPEHTPHEPFDLLL